MDVVVRCAPRRRGVVPWPNPRSRFWSICASVSARRLTTGR